MQNNPRVLLIGAILLFAMIFGGRLFRTIQPGTVGVAVLFGRVIEPPKPAGFHIVNPLYNWVIFDVRQKTYKESADIPTSDQLKTTVDVSVQYRVIGSQAPKILSDTGTALNDLLTIHMQPRLRSLMFELGKSIPQAENFFLEETQRRLQLALEEGMIEFMRDKGVLIEAILVRDITLPPFIRQAIEKKKEREQLAEQQKAELERFTTEQRQVVAKANAEREAAEQQAKQKRIIADANAYEIERLNKAIGRNPAYIQIQALKALEAISKDPAAKVYFIDGDSPLPLPLMHMGDALKQRN